MRARVDEKFASFILALGVGGFGAILAVYMGLPVPFLTGSAFAVGISAILGLRFHLPPSILKIAFALIGINIGSGVSAQTLVDAAKWPLSLVILFICVITILVVASFALQILLRLERHEAILTASPGHLSFVIGLGLDRNIETSMISVSQTIRVFFLTLAVPFLFIESVGTPSSAQTTIMHWGWVVGMVGLAWLATPLLTKFRIPAAPLIAGMLLSTVLHLNGNAQGALHPWLTSAVFVMLGALIGSRFVDCSREKLKACLPAGIIITITSLSVATIFAYIDSQLLNIPFAQAFIAFAPGGIETMIAISLHLNVDTSFVAAHHVARFFILTPILIWMMRKVR